MSGSLGVVVIELHVHGLARGIFKSIKTRT